MTCLWQELAVYLSCKIVGIGFAFQAAGHMIDWFFRINSIFNFFANVSLLSR